VSDSEIQQRSLFGEAPVPGTALFLSIQAEHAKRIYEGKKIFELRKALPRTPFRRTFLYESGTGLVTGCFDVAEVLEQPIDELWRTVGEAGTTRERFLAYFTNARVGFAIAIRRAVRFRVPLPVDLLRRADAKFRVPISSLLLRDADPALTVLERKRTEELLGTSPLVQLRAIDHGERAIFVSAVTEEVGRNYADITEQFARRTLEVHDAGKDDSGFLTTGKEVLSVCSENGTLLGFTAVTFKSGGSLKTGPTLLFPQNRRRGYGLGMRFALERYALDHGGRKLYCTCPDRSRAVIGNLLACGFRVEAHLRQHYSLDHSEFIFGKVLSAGPPPTNLSFARGGSRAGSVVGAGDFAAGEAARFVWSQLPNVLAKIPMATAKRMVVGATTHVEAQHYEAKPRRILLLRSGSECVGAAILIAKRGGCMKLVLLLATAHTPSIERLLFAAEFEARRSLARKLYCVHPALDVSVVDLLYSHAFVSEGVLAEPYRPGVDALVLTKGLA
jgi:predicted transcriptional regulator